MNRLLLKAMACLALSVGVMTYCPGRAGAGTLTPEDVVPYKSIAPLEESTIERTSIVAVSAIVGARSAIHRQDMKEAKTDIDDAVRLTATIANGLSSADARNLILIARKHLEFEPSREVLDDLPAIDRALDRESLYLPTDRARSHVYRAGNYLERSEKRGADRELALADQSLYVVTVDMPLIKARRHIDQARSFLATGEPSKADGELKTAERQTMALYSLVTSPLIEARQNLWAAFRNYSTARRDEIGPFLERAGGKLHETARGGSAAAGEETGILARDVMELKRKLTAGETVASSDLKAVWERSEALAERSAAYLSADLAEEETTLRGDNSLIEAKLHLDFAETYQVTTREPAKAVRELDTVAAFLHRSAGSYSSSAGDRHEIEKMEREIRELKTASGKSGEEVQDRYEALAEGLRKLIRKL